jgi:hypothetical protein
MAIESMTSANETMASPGVTVSKQRLLKKRYAAEARFKAYGIAAIVFGLSFLAILFTSIISRGYTAFQQSAFTLNVELDPAVISPSGKNEEITPRSPTKPFLPRSASTPKASLTYGQQLSSSPRVLTFRSASSSWQIPN